MRIAVQGCGHGQQHEVHAAAQRLRADVLLVCGDYQAVRDARDLADMAVPARYRKMGDFVEYFAGRSAVPMPSLFVGGNHEAPRHLWELFHGGFAAPGVLYMGHAGAYTVGGLTVAGISGIAADSADAAHGYCFGCPREHAARHCRVPAHTTRAFEAARMHAYAALLRSGAFGNRRVDVFLSHEWPRGAAEAGDLAALLRRKPYFASDVSPGGRGLGTAALQRVLDDVRPARWFAAHLHVRHEANFRHPDGTTTSFVALDKCLPGRAHMDVFDAGGALSRVQYDPAWLAVVRAFDPFMPLGCVEARLPSAEELRLDEHVAFVKQRFGSASLDVPEPAGPFDRSSARRQTSAFCAMLGIRDHWACGA